MEEYFFCYVTIKLTNKYIVLLSCKGACPHVRPGKQAFTGEELEIRVWQNLAQLVGGWEGGTELE